MEVLSSWVTAVFRKRLEQLEQQMTLKEQRKEAVAIWEELSQTLTQEQLQVLLKWEEKTNRRITEEKERLYFCGVSDGCGLIMGMNELMGKGDE